MAERVLEIGTAERLLDGWLVVDRMKLRHGRFEGGLTRWLERVLARRGAAVVVLPYDPVQDAVVLIEQFRVGAIADARTAWLIETVAGFVDPGSGVEAAARQELAEEAGLDALDLVPVYEAYTTPGHSDEYLYGLIARVDASRVSGSHGRVDEDEDIRPFVLPFAEAMAWWRAGRIRNLPAVAVLLALAVERERLRAVWT